MQLLLDRKHPRRQQAAQSQGVAFALGESRSFVEQGVGQQGGTPGEDRTSMRIKTVIGGRCSHAISKAGFQTVVNEICQRAWERY